MHKDKPPGLFDFAERSIRYLVAFWFVAGLSLSILVRTGILIKRDDKGSATRNPDALEAEAMARKPASATTPPPTDAVRF
jgi:hypothetical protein